MLLLVWLTSWLGGTPLHTLSARLDLIANIWMVENDMDSCGSSTAARIQGGWLPLCVPGFWAGGRILCLAIRSLFRSFRYIEVFLMGYPGIRPYRQVMMRRRRWKLSFYRKS